MEIKSRIKIGLLGLTLLIAGVGFQIGNFAHSFEERMENSKGESEENEGEEFAGAAKYLSEIRSYSKREDVIAVMRQMDALSSQKKSYKTDPLQWNELGPDNQGGRTYNLVVDKDDNKTLYAGSVSGGMFKSTNSGASWFKCGTDSIKSLAVKSLVQTSNGDLYYGTGEFSLRFVGGDGNSGVIGRGIFKSTDKGANFRQLKATDPANPYSNNNTWDYIHTLAADPNDANGKTVLAGTDNGIQITTDGGTTWAPLSKANSAVSGYTKCTDIKISEDGKIYLAAMQTSNSQTSVIIRSDDQGKTWARTGNTVINGSDKVSTASVRIEIAFSPTNSNIAYLSSANLGFKLEGIYKTIDGGKSWNYILKGGSPYLDPFIQTPDGRSPQGDYDNCIGVDPFNEDRVFVGGVHLYEGKLAKGGTSYQWRTVAVLNYDEENPNAYFNKFYIHADKHGISFDSKGKIMFVTTDGGIFKSTDFSTLTDMQWKEINNGYSTIQFYAVAVNFLNWDLVFGGTQDNGTLQVNKGGITKKYGESIKGGDGAYTIASKIIPTAQLAESQYASMQRSLDGKTFVDFLDEPAPNANGRNTGKNGLKNKAGTSAYGAFVNPMRLWEEIKDTIIKDPATGEKFIERDKTRSIFAFAFTDGIYVSREILVFSKNPEVYKLFSYNEYPITMEFAPEGDVLYYASRGSSGSIVHRISGLKRYREFQYKDTVYGFDPAMYGVKDTIIFSSSTYPILGIGVNPKNGNQVVLTLGGYGNSTGHVFYSNNAKTDANFTNIQANLPNFPVYDAEINFKDNKHIVLGTEAGIWTGYDMLNGGRWEESNGNKTGGVSGIPRVPVFMLNQLDIAENNNGKSGPVFYAASHGRGFYRAGNLITVSIQDQLKEQEQNTSLNLFPNPSISVTTLSYNVGKTGSVNFQVYDLSGKLIEFKNLGNQQKGDNSYQFNVSNYNNGTYIVRMNISGIDKVVKFQVSK